MSPKKKTDFATGAKTERFVAVTKSTHAPAGRDETLLDFGAGKTHDEIRRDALRDQVSAHMGVLFSRYHQLGARVFDPAYLPNIEEILHRDHAEFKCRLYREGIRASRAEIAAAFREVLQRNAASLRVAPSNKAHYFREFYRVFSHVLSFDPGLKHLHPSRITHPADGAAAVAAARQAASEYWRLIHAGTDVDIGEYDVATEFNRALDIGAATMVDHAEELGTPVQARKMRRALQEYVDSSIRSIKSPDLKRLVEANHHSPEQLFKALETRVAEHNLALAAGSARALPAPQAKDVIRESLSQLEVPVEVVPAFADHIRRLTSEINTDGGAEIAKGLSAGIHSSVKVWINNSDPVTFRGRLNRLLGFVVKQPYHPAVELELTRLRDKIGAHADREFDRVAGKTPDYDAVYAKHPKVEMLKQYVSSLQVATSELAEQHAKRRPFG